MLGKGHRGIVLGPGLHPCVPEVFWRQLEELPMWNVLSPLCQPLL